MVERTQRIVGQGLSRPVKMLELRLGAHGGERDVAPAAICRFVGPSLGGSHGGERQTDCQREVSTFRDGSNDSVLLNLLRHQSHAKLSQSSQIRNGVIACSERCHAGTCSCRNDVSGLQATVTKIFVVGEPGNRAKRIAED